MPIAKPIPGLFVYMPHPPTLGKGENSDQSRFGGHFAVEQKQRCITGTGVRLTVYRHAESETGELMVSHTIKCYETATSNIELTADEMQTLACALLDAAHDLRTRPAVSHSSEVDHA